MYAGFNSRLIVLSLSIALSFAILILFIDYLEGIVVSVFFLTAVVVVASRDDLKDLSSAKATFIVFIIVVTASLVAVGASFPQIANIVFIPLSLGDLALIVAYAFMRRSAHLSEESTF